MDHMEDEDVNLSEIDFTELFEKEDEVPKIPFMAVSLSWSLVQSLHHGELEGYLRNAYLLDKEQVVFDVVKTKENER